MCKLCVDEGRMTQDELDARLAEGDTTVQAMVDQSPEVFATSLAEMVAEAVEAGMPLGAATLVAALVAEEYREARAGLN